MKVTGVDGLADRPFGVISEGERQQVLLARLLMGEPGLLLLDEPFAGLDLGARERLLARLAGLTTDPVTPPMVLVTHHVEEIPPGTTHALVLGGGRVVAGGPIERRADLRHAQRRVRLPDRARSRRRPLVGPRPPLRRLLRSFRREYASPGRRELTPKGGSRSVGGVGSDVIGLDDDVPAVEAVLAPVHRDVTGAVRRFGIGFLDEVRTAAAVDADDDGRGTGHVATTRPEPSIWSAQVWSRPRTCMKRPIDMYFPITSVSSTI